MFWPPHPPLREACVVAHALGWESRCAFTAIQSRQGERSSVTACSAPAFAGFCARGCRATLISPSLHVRSKSDRRTTAEHYNVFCGRPLRHCLVLSVCVGVKSCVHEDISSAACFGPPPSLEGGVRLCARLGLGVALCFHSDPESRQGRALSVTACFGTSLCASGSRATLISPSLHVRSKSDRRTAVEHYNVYLNIYI